MKYRRWIGLFGLVLAGTAAASLVVSRLSGPPRDPLPGSPRVFLWAWERPEDMRFLPRDVGVAVLAGTLTVGDSEMRLRPRMQPLTVAEGTSVIAVVRVEVESRNAPAESRGGEAAEYILGLARGRTLPAFQIDFDATVSQRPFYRRMLERLREGLPAGMRLSITALASWCIGDPWIEDLPVDEAVPMLFQMGPDGMDVDRLLARGGDFGPEVCRHSLGISTGEPLRNAPAGRRVYVFHPRRWTQASAESAIRRAKQWQ